MEQRQAERIFNAWKRRTRPARGGRWRPWIPGAALLAALAGAARAEPPPLGSADLPPPPPPPPAAPGPTTTMPEVALPPPPPPPPAAAELPAPPAPAPETPAAAPPAPGAAKRETMTSAPSLEATIEARNKAIKERWEWLIGGGTIFAANYSFAALFAETDYHDSDEDPPRELSMLYVPVAGPFIVFATGDLRFDDAGPLPLFAGLFQGFGLFSIIYGIALPDPEAARAALTVQPTAGGAAISMAGAW